MKPQNCIEQIDQALDRADKSNPERSDEHKNLLVQSIKEVLLCMPDYTQGLTLGTSGYGYLLPEGSYPVRTNSKVTCVAENHVLLDDENGESYSLDIKELNNKQLYELLKHTASVVKYYLQVP